MVVFAPEIKKDLCDKDGWSGLVASAEGAVSPDRAMTLKFQLAQLEAELLRRALQEEKGDRLAAAGRLGISKSSLYAKVEQYGIK